MTDEQPPLNRAERRRRRFHPHQGGHVQDNLVRESENVSSRLRPTEGESGGSEAPETSEAVVADEAVAGGPDEGSKRTTGAGTGGATESDDRLVHHEGIHQPGRPNG